MTSAGKLLLAVAAATVFAGVQCYRLNNVLSENQMLRRELLSETQARNSAEWLLRSQEQAMQVFSAIRAANRAADAADETERNETRQTITQAVAGDDCASRAVPDPAVNELHRRENYARAISGFDTPD